MSNEGPEVTLPEKAHLTAEGLKQEMADRFRHIDALLYAVVAAIIITSVASLVAVLAIVIDQLHFNNQTYRDTSKFRDENSQLQQQVQKLQYQLDMQKLTK